ncbi:selenocysteine-specific translation elongation factor [Flexivirga oryzae]|uniref:Selenocysteine-specific elongation factor n=1 Tax=Flexivirga oryzae TaxID=1794944 RepID=A0A839NB37_9MICO|nr:selenocysteine-specific translation elongation factor [Flexivirga oryzae]MBB2893194.1 selenocysteine-specific elongation factor [Flexivirga oryzae]
MYVVATAGHVDHGKSTLVRAITGIEPDRWDEEKRRGLTIDLGFAWTTTPSGNEVSFVDVPGHERFLGNMLAGIGPAPVVCFVVAADEGWRQQSDDHRDAVRALGIEHGVVVISRIDLAPDRVPEVVTQIRRELSDTGLRDAPIVPVSAVTGEGLDQLLATLDRVLVTVPKPPADSRIRFWIDRAFTIKGAGTVVTGTLSAGTVRPDDRLVLAGSHGAQEVTVRGVQEHGAVVPSAGPANRVALNLRSPGADQIHRGDVLLTRGDWQLADVVDVRRTSGVPCHDAAGEVIVHIGTAAVRAHLRPFDEDTARLTLVRALPLTIGDRMILRNNGSQRIAGGVQVLDVDPPALRRRGDGRRRAAALAADDPAGPIRAEVARRGAMRVADLRRLGVIVPDHPVDGLRTDADWWIDERRLHEWAAGLRAAVEDDRARNPLSSGLSHKAAADAIALPDVVLLGVVVREAELAVHGPSVTTSQASEDLGPAEAAVSEVERRLQEAPFAAPEADELTELGLGRRELAAAERTGRLLRLADGVVLLPTAPAQAMRELVKLPRVFTTSEARGALRTTRRVAIPLLEHLDARGWTRRIDAGHRTVVRAGVDG